MFINDRCPECHTTLHFADAALGVCPCCGYDGSEGSYDYDEEDWEDLEFPADYD